MDWIDPKAPVLTRDEAETRRRVEAILMIPDVELWQMGFAAEAQRRMFAKALREEGRRTGSIPV